MADANTAPLPPALEQRYQGNLYATITVTRALAWLAVALRIWARRRGGTRLWWDDWIIFGVAILLLIPDYVLAIFVIYYGAGRHVAAIVVEDPAQLVMFSKITFFDTWFYPLIITPVKCSFLCLFIRLFGISKPFTRACQVLLTLSIVWGLVTLFLFIFQCNPIQNNWLSATREGCLDFKTLLIGTNIPNIVLDFAILVTPIFPIWNLQLPILKKLAVTAILLVGTAEVAISIVRVTKVVNLDFTDITWSDGTALTWSAVEANVGVICACLPVLAPLLPRRVRDAMASRSQGQDRRYKLSSNNHRLSYIRPKDNRARVSSEEALSSQRVDGARSRTSSVDGTIDPNLDFGLPTHNSGIQRTVTIQVERELNSTSQ